MPKFDGVALGEGSFNFMGTGHTLEGKASFVNTLSGDTYGWTKNNIWSPATIAKLQELRALMEIDLGRVHLVDGGESLVGPTSLSETTVGSSGLGSMGGLGEHVGSV
jgi:hypothetical protein